MAWGMSNVKFKVADLKEDAIAHKKIRATSTTVAMDNASTTPFGPETPSARDMVSVNMGLERIGQRKPEII